MGRYMVVGGDERDDSYPTTQFVCLVIQDGIYNCVLSEW
jgi:hypothetical protein